MFMLNEIRAQLRKWPDDPICVHLLKDLEHHYGYDINDGTGPHSAYQKYMDDVQAMYKLKDAVKKQCCLIELNKKLRMFKQDPAVPYEIKCQAERLMLDMANMVLGTNIISFATE